MKRLLWVRHPEVIYNVPPSIRLRGGLDLPLSSRGYSQIPIMTDRLRELYPNVDCVRSSPLERASTLATAIAHAYNVKVIKMEGLGSWDYGCYNGRLVSEVEDVLSTLSTGSGRDLAPKGGQSMNDFLAKLTADIKTARTEASETGTTLIVTHLQCIMMGVHWLVSGLPEDVSSMPYEYRENNEIEPGGWIEVKRDWTVVRPPISNPS